MKTQNRVVAGDSIVGRSYKPKSVKNRFDLHVGNPVFTQLLDVWRQVAIHIGSDSSRSADVKIQRGTLSAGAQRF